MAPVGERRRQRPWTAAADRRRREARGSEPGAPLREITPGLRPLKIPWNRSSRLGAVSLDLAHDVRGPLGHRTPVVLLHAFPLERSMWREVAGRLAAAGVPTVAVDLPG